MKPKNNFFEEWADMFGDFLLIVLIIELIAVGVLLFLSLFI